MQSWQSWRDRYEDMKIEVRDLTHNKRLGCLREVIQYLSSKHNLKTSIEISATLTLTIYGVDGVFDCNYTLMVGEDLLTVNHNETKVWQAPSDQGYVDVLVCIEAIFTYIAQLRRCKQNFQNKATVLVTAGGTEESIDPVRCITNYSSGKMGIALAMAARSFSDEVTLISSVDTSYIPGVNIIRAKSVAEMRSAVLHGTTDGGNICILVMAAALSDFRVLQPYEQKLKKDGRENLTLELTRNPNFIRELDENVIKVGFSAESENLLDNALKKLRNRGFDLIFANDISRHDIGFSSDYNQITIVERDGTITELARGKKLDISFTLLEFVRDNLVSCHA